MSVDYQLFPRSQSMPPILMHVVACFEAHLSDISSSSHKLNSDQVLSIVSGALERVSFKVEKGKKKEEKIQVPVLFGKGNIADKYFYADAVSSDRKVVLEVEAGRAVDNNQFLKDIFQACMMHEVEYLVIAVRCDYRGKNDFSRVYAFLETLYISNRLQLPLSGILLIGY